MADQGETGGQEQAKEADSFSCPHCKQTHPLFMTRCPETGQTVDQVYKMAGRVLEGKYKVGRMKGEGGMGVVYAGTHLKIGRRLAIKFLRRGTTAGSQIVERFQNEARIAASVGHRNIVDILDMGSTRENIPYIVMEYLEGNDLGEILDTTIRFPQPLAVDFAVQILGALRAVHEQGIVHRDLKPENVFIVNEAGGGITLKIVDFGVSRLGRAEGKPLSTTRSGAVFGTPRYMAPEQARGSKSVDLRADLYSVGVLLYQMLTGAVPFEAADYNNMIISLTTEDPIPVDKHGIALSVGLTAVVMKALARDPGARFQTAGEFIEALLPFKGQDLDLERSISGSIPSIPGWSSPSSPTPSIRVGDATGPSLSESGPHENPTLRPDEGPISVDGGGASVTGGSTWSASRSGQTHPAPVPVIRRRIGPGWLLAVIVSAAVLGLGGVAAYVLVKARSIEKRVVALAGDPVHPATGPGEAALEGPVLWKVELEGLPAGAEVYVDGTLHPELPLTVSEARGSRLIRVVADGYETWEKQVAIHGDLSIAIRMDPASGGEETGGGEKQIRKPGKGKEGEGGQETKSKIDTEYPGLE